MVDNRVVVGAEDALHIGIRVRIQGQAVSENPLRFEFLDGFSSVVAQVLRVAFVDVGRLAVRHQ